MNYTNAIKKFSSKIFNENFKDDEYKQLHYLIDRNCIESFFNTFIEDIYVEIEKMVSDCLIYEFQDFREKKVNSNNNQDDSIKEIKNEFFEKLLKADEYEKFKNKYLVLFSNIVRNITNMKNHIENLLSDYSENIEGIQGTFGNMGRIAKIDLNLGDMHEGKSVTKVYFEEGILFFKPRRLELDRLVSVLIDRIKLKNKEKNTYIYNLRTPIFFESAENSWQENIAYSSNLSEDDLKSFFYNAGVYLGIFYVLGISDLHFENIIYTKGTPVFIDLETITPPAVTDENIDWTKYLLNRSVLATALLPLYNDSLGLNMSGLFSSKQETPKITFETLIENDDYGWVYEKKNGYINPGEKSLLENKENIDPMEYLEYLVSGFRETMGSIILDKEYYINFLYSQKELSLRIRILLRHTAIYAKFIEASNNPEYLTSFEKQNKIFDILEDNYQPDKFGYIRVESEITSMKNGDIPLFYTYFSSKDIYINGNRLIENYFKESIYDEIIQKLDYLNMDMVNYQIFMINLSMTSLIKAYEFDTLNNRKLLKQEKNLDNLVYFSGLEKFFEKEKDIFFQTGNEFIDYYRLDLVSKNDSKIDLSKFGLYDSTGYLICLHEYGEKFNKKEYTLYAKKMYRNLLNKFLALAESEELFNDYDVSVYFGTSGLLYTSYYLLRKDEGEYLDNFKIIYDKLISAIKYQLKEGKLGYDYISGISGIIVLLSEIYMDSKGKYVSLDIIEEFTISMLNMKYKENKVGIAHGELGVANALINYSRCTHLEDKIKNIIDDIIYNENIYTNNYEWCNGSVGYIDVLTEYYILLRRNGYSEKKIKNNIINFFSDSKELFSSKSLSLCHGVFGTVDIMYNIFRNNKELFMFIPNKKEILETVSSFYLEDLSKVKWTDNTDITCNSFMTGASGIAYEIMRIRDCKLNSILKLKF